MGRYLVQRLLLMLPTLLLISLVTFVIIQLPPGDYLETLISDLESSGERADLAKVEFLRKEFGLDQPLWKQYGLWLWGLFQGDLGYSFEYDRPVADIIGERLLLTFVVSFALDRCSPGSSRFRSACTRRPTSTAGATTGSRSSASSAWRRRTSCWH